ncbi:MAG: methyl-accepting chemotaxis protein, partial [Gallionella sp.]
GIEEVNQAIVQMDNVTQQNAALVEEAAASAEAMQGQAETLKQAVSFFKLQGENANEKTATSAKPSAKAVIARPASAPTVPTRKERRGRRRTAETKVVENDGEWKEF